MTREDAWKFAEHWIAGWNSHDLEVILSHYDNDVVLVSPVAAHLLGNPTGEVQGITALRAYFRRGLEAFPQLHFHLEDVLWGINSVVLYYANQKATKSAEFMALSPAGKVTRVVANYNA